MRSVVNIIGNILTTYFNACFRVVSFNRTDTFILWLITFFCYCLLKRQINSCFLLLVCTTGISYEIEYKTYPRRTVCRNIRYPQSFFCVQIAPEVWSNNRAQKTIESFPFRFDTLWPLSVHFWRERLWLSVMRSCGPLPVSRGPPSLRHFLR